MGIVLKLAWCGICFCPFPELTAIFGHGSKVRTSSDHPNHHQKRLKWVVPQNVTLGFDSQPFAFLAGFADVSHVGVDLEQPLPPLPRPEGLRFPRGLSIGSDTRNEH